MKIPKEIDERLQREAREEAHAHDCVKLIRELQAKRA